MSASKELTFHYVDIFSILQICLKKEKIIFRSYNYKIHTVTCIKIAEWNTNENDKELQDSNSITVYLHGSNILLIKFFDDKDIPNSTEELKKIFKTFIENDKLC